MDPFATVAELQAAWRPLCGDEPTRAGALLAKASRRIRRLYPDVDSRIASGDLSIDDVKDVVIDMAIRGMPIENDESGTISETDTRGPFSKTRRFARPRGEMYMTEDDEAVFDPDGGSDKAFQIDTTPATVTTYGSCWWLR